MSSFMKDYNKWKKTGSFNKEKKSLVKTGLTAANYLGQGALKGAESVFVDAPLQIAGGVKKLFGDEKGAKDLFEAANVNLTNAAINKLAGKEANPYITNNQNLFNEQLDQNSLIKENNIGGIVVQGIGEMLPTIALTGGISGVGKAAKTAKQLETARKIGSNALLGTKAFAGSTNEAYQESGDIGKSILYGLGNAAVEIGTERISDGIPGLKKIKGDTTKSILKNYGKSVVGEGLEEIASDLLNPFLQTTYKGGEALKQYGDAEYWKDVAESGLVGSLTGGLLDAPNTISSINTNKALTKASKQKLPGMRTEQSISNNIKELKQEQQATTDNKLKQELATRISGLEQELKQFKLPMASTEGMTLQESASKYNIKPETQSNVQQLMENRGIESRWDATKFSDNSVNALWTKDANGNRSVIFNPNASLDTIVEEVAVHELTHDILSSENTTLNPTEILDYVSQLDGYNEARQSLIDTYKDMYDINSAEFNSLIDEEVVADVLGRKLGNQEFINQLVNSKPSIAKSIYNWVVSKLNSIINNGKVRSEKLYWQNIKNNFENAYKQEYKNNEMASTKYKVSKQMLEKEFTKLTGDSKLQADAKMGRYAFQLIQKQNGNFDGEVVAPYNEEAMKLYNELENSKKTSSHLYHSTPVDRIQSIIKNGLQVGSKQNQEGVSSTNKLYLSATEELADSFTPENSIMLRISPSANLENLDYDLLGGEGSYTITNNIEPKYLQVKENGKWVNLLKSNYANEDIRYSKENAEWNEFLDKNLKDTGTSGTLMAIHNLSEDKLKGILELGGFPVPSIAITNPNIVSHEGYGKISVLFDKSTIDPAVKENEVYDRDVWSPRFPTVDREVNSNNVDKVAERIGMSDSSLQSLAEDYNNPEVLASRLSRDSDVVEKYLDDNNIKYTKEDNIYKLAEANGIVEYLNNEVKDIYGRKGIYNGKSYITDSGNRRTFWQLHDDYNLENIVKNLKSQDTVSSETGIFGSTFGNVQANMSNRFKSIDDIKANESKIMSSEKANAEVQKIVDEFNQEAAELSKLYGDKFDPFWDMDSINYQMQELSKLKNVTAQGFYDIANKYNPTLANADSKLVDRIVNTMNKLKNIPTDYFEAKPQRAVGLDEVAAVVIPNNTTEEFRKALKDAGLDFVEYDPNVEGDRQRVINTFDNLKFSKGSPEWNSFVNKHVAPEGTKTKLRDIKQPKKEVSLPKSTQVKQKTNLPMVKEEPVLKVNASQITNEMNSVNGKRGWIGTAAQSDVLKDTTLIKDLDTSKLNYVVESNQKSVDTANNHLDTYGYEKSLEDVKSMLRSDKLPKASDVALAERLLQEAIKNGDTKTAQDLIMDIAILGTDLGQATQALSMINRLTPEGQLKMYTKIIERAKARGDKAYQDVEITTDMVQNVLDAYNEDGTYDQQDLNNRVENFKQEIANQMKTTIGEKINAWRYLSMLGNPKTHIRNIVSNVAMNGTIKVKNAMARTLESVLPIANRTKTWKKASTEIQNYANKTADEMKGIITGENKYNEKTALETKKQVFKNKTLEKLSDFNSNALEAEDWFFSKKAFKSTLQEYLTANGINTLEDIKNNPEVVEKAKIYAVEQAEIATFRQYSKLANAVNNLEKNNKAARLFIEATMPFKKTPINVAKAGVKYSPLGLIKAISYDIYQVKQGNMEASQFIDNLSQGLTGTSLAILGYALAKAGILNGAGGDDKDDKYDSQLGDNQYSLKIGDKSYSISWLSPVAMPLLVGANAYEQLEEKEEWDMNVVSDTLAKTLDPLNEMSFMQGLTNALTSYGSGVDKIKGSLESVGQNYVGQFFPTLFSQFASTIDDKKRSTKASANSTYKFGEQTLRSVMYKLPGLRQQLEVATDIWGNEKEQADNIIQRAYESFIAPYSTTKNITSDLDKELKRVYNKTGETGVIPSVPYAYVKYGDETYRMSAKEYTQYKKTYGQTSYKLLNNTIQSQNYKTLSDEEKANVLENIFGYSKYVANKEYFNNTNTKYTSKEYDKVNLYSKVGKVSDYYLSKVKKFEADKDANGKTISGSAKKKVVNYINSLNASIPEKAMLIKLYGNFTFDDYNKQIIEYVNGKNITKSDKEELLTKLGFKIKDGRVYSK